MWLENLGIGCFRLRGPRGIVVTDPYDHVDVSAIVAGADLVTSSRGGRDMCLRDEGGAIVVDGPGEYEVRGVFVTGVLLGAVCGDAGGAGSTTAYNIIVDDISVCHLGHLSSVPTQEEVDALGTIDVLLLPVGGNPVLGPSQAVEVLSVLDPAIIVPMHYRSVDLPDVEPLERFIKAMGIDEVEPVQRLTVTRGNLPEERQVVVLDRPR